MRNHSKMSATSIKNILTIQMFFHCYSNEQKKPIVTHADFDSICARQSNNHKSNDRPRTVSAHLSIAIQTAFTDLRREKCQTSRLASGVNFSRTGKSREREMVVGWSNTSRMRRCGHICTALISRNEDHTREQTIRNGSGARERLFSGVAKKRTKGMRRRGEDKKN